MSYVYRYETPSSDASEEEAAAVARENVSRSLEVDSLRVDLGPSASELHARVVAETAKGNGR